MTLDQKIKKLKNLKQYINTSEEELTNIAKEQLIEEELLQSISSLIKEEEKKFALDLLRKYTYEKQFESSSEKDTLNQLIYTEVIVERIKQHLNKEFEKDAYPLQMLEELRALNDQVLKYKEALKMDKEKEQSEWIEVWEILKKKALNYYEESRGENTLKCPYCQGIFHLLVRLENKDIIKSTWFKKSLLYNKKVFELYHDKKITKDEAAEILGVSIQYIDYLYENLFLKEKIDK